MVRDVQTKSSHRLPTEWTCPQTGCDRPVTDLLPTGHAQKASGGAYDWVANNTTYKGEGGSAVVPLTEVEKVRMKLVEVV